MSDRTAAILKIVEAVDRLSYTRLNLGQSRPGGFAHSANKNAVKNARAHLHDVLDEVLPGKPVCAPTKPWTCPDAGETLTLTWSDGRTFEVPIHPKQTGSKGRPQSKDPCTIELLFGEYGLCPVEFCYGGWSKDVTFNGLKIATIRKRDKTHFTHSMQDSRGFTVETGSYPSLKAAFAGVIQANEEKRKGSTDADLI